MTESEAIKEFQQNIDMPFGSNISREASELAIQALEKQMPMKPTFDHNISDKLSMFRCECGNLIKVKHDIGTMNNNSAPNYCSNCGQKLKWRVEENE